MTENAGLDANAKPTLIGVSDLDSSKILKARIDPTTKRLLVDNTGDTGYSLDSFNIIRSSPSAFTGNTDSTRGDADNTPTTDIFAVTGEVLVGIFGVCTTNLVQDGATATLALGVAGNTGALISATNVNEIDANEIWLDTSPTVGVNTIDALTYFIIVNGLNIIETVATKDVDSGQMFYSLLWRPIGTTGSVVEGSLISS